MKVNKSQEIKTISDRIKQAVWNGELRDSKGYIVDLSNIGNTMEITATIEETPHEQFTTEAHFYIRKDKVDIEKAIKQYEEMKNPYIFNVAEYNNILKLTDETQKMFLGSLLNIETRIANTENKEIKSDDLRVRLFKKENEKKNLYVEKEKTEKEYMELSKKKEENTRNINKYVEILKRNSEMFRPINILNRIFSKQETEEQNKYYKSEAVKLEKENIKNTELIFEKMFYKNELNKQIQSIEKEVNKLREQNKLEDKTEEKKTDILKEKNMLFKVFGIDIENESIKENEMQIEQESEEENG